MCIRDRQRPHETAQIILQNNNDLKIEKIDSLVEISHGLWEGKLESEIREKWPLLLKNWHEKPEEVIMPEGESIKDVSERSIKAFDKICLSQKDNDCLLYTSDAADDPTCVDLGGRRIIKKINYSNTTITLFNHPNI